MSSWRDQILKEFTPRVAKLTLVADPDGLFLEEKILETIKECGFELLSFEDHISFRYAYESLFRSRWDRGEHTDLVVLLHSHNDTLIDLPYDLLRFGRRLSFNLGDIFPNLSYPIVTALDRGDFDILYEAQKKYAPGPLGDNATKDFILRHVFEIASELIRQPIDLLRVLLRRHYSCQRIPTLLDERFIQLIRQNPVFESWPIERMVPDRDVFFAFLQERWPIYLDREVTDASSNVLEDRKSYALIIDGPIDLPFDHHDIRVYIDNLFVDGLLSPVSHYNADTLSKTWAGIGVRSAPQEDKSRRLGKLIQSLQKTIPADNARHNDWFHFAHGWAELVFLLNEQPDVINVETKKQVDRLQVQVDKGFTNWLLKRYAGLTNLPPVPPVMLHHIPRFLARQIGEDSNARIALIVIDGLAMDQWLVVRNALSLRQPNFRFREESVFAWIPSLTSISRQAVFAGKAPIFFPNSIQTTDKEPILWMQFWLDQGFMPNEVLYFKGLGDSITDTVSEALSQPIVRVAGLVVDKVDRIMHGMEMGTAGMHNQVYQWAKQPFLNDLLNLLLGRGYRVFLTSDHGNIEAIGCGRPAEGSLADLRGERVRIYSDATLRGKVKEHFPTALEWDSLGLPENCLALLAPARQAFIQDKQHIVSHGGISVEEILVPLVQIERKTE